MLPLMVGVLAWAASAQAAGYRIETVATGLVHPWSLAFLPGGRLLVTERPGRLRLPHGLLRLGQWQLQPVNDEKAHGLPGHRLCVAHNKAEQHPGPDARITQGKRLGLGGCCRRHTAACRRAHRANRRWRT